MTDLTIKELRSEWVEFASTFSGRGEARKYEEMFDRCLAQRDAEVQAQAFEAAAVRVRADFAAHGEQCPWVGFLDDEAARLRAARLTDTSEGEEK